MRYIANIVTKNKIETSEFFNVTSDFNSVDTSLPTLIVGWKEVKELFPEQDILTYNITPLISWTFSKKERRYKYEKDIAEFIAKISRSINETLKYRFFNYILSSDEKKESFISYVNKGGCSIYHNSRFLYIYNPDCDLTVGVSLQDLRYTNMNVGDFLKNLNRFNNNLVTDNLDFISTDSLALIKDNIKAAAYLNYLKNCDIYKETPSNGKEHNKKV